MPKFTKLISCDRLEDSIVACFLADDGRSYVAEFSQDVCQALLRELQTAAIGETQELLAVTMTGLCYRCECRWQSFDSKNP